MFNSNPAGPSNWTLGSTGGYYGNTSTGLGSAGRIDAVTRGKRKAVKYIIKVL